MYYYQLYGLVFRSNFEISQLVPSISGTHFDADIIFGAVPDLIKNFENQKYNAGYTKDSLWFKNDKGLFYITKGTQIFAEPINDTENKVLIPFIIGYCVSTLFGQRNMLAVHCSAVRVNKKGILLAGFSGSGKSSLTTRFLENNSQLIADDIAVIGMQKDDNATIFPGFPQQNLCLDAVERYGYDKTSLIIVDAERDKYSIKRTQQFYSSPSDLSAMFILTPSDVDNVSLEEITGADMLKQFIDNLFFKDAFLTQGSQAEQMQTCIKIVKSLPMFRLYRPLQGDTTQIQMNLIKAILE